MSERTRRRPRSAPGHGDRLGPELVEAAREILAREGSTDAVTLRGVARHLGVTAPSIYLHFDSREDLVAAAVAAQFDRLRRATEEAARGADTPLARLRAGMLGYCRFGEEEPGGYAVLFSLPLAPAVLHGSSDPAARALDSAAGRAFDGLVASVAACQDDGSLPGDDAWPVARRAWTALHGMVSLRTVMPAFDWDPIEDAVDDLLLGLGASASA